jgi:hypothetical protein
MPYRHAHWYLLALFPLAGLAFWQGYLSQLRTSSLEFHLHGITASLWLLLLAAQSWTIHHGSRGVHRTLGTASLLLFPLFMMGGAGIFFGMADRYVSGSPFHAMYAPRLAWLDVVAVAGFGYFYYEALRQRRKVHAHSGYLLATSIALLPPIFGRLSAIPLGVTGPQDFWKLGYGFQAANLIAAGIAFVIAARRERHGRPFALAGVLMLLSAVLFEVPGRLAAWQALYARVADLPTMPSTVAAGLAGVAIGYAGWIAGRRPGLGTALPA